MKRFLFSQSGSISAGLIILLVVVGATLYFTNFFTIRQYPETGPRGIVGNIVSNKTDTLAMEDLPIQAVTVAPTSAPGDPTSPPAPTTPPDACYDNAAVLFMVDRSGSMGHDGLRELREAIASFATHLTDTSLIGIQSFSADDASSPPDIREHLPISEYGSVRSNLNSILNSIELHGSTPTKSALLYSLNTLREATGKNSGRNFTYIFMTDGQPNPAIEEHPGIPNPADDIRALGVTVYGIGAKVSNDQLTIDVINSIASDPDSQYVYISPTFEELTEIYNQIAQRICN